MQVEEIVFRGKKAKEKPANFATQCLLLLDPQ